VFLAATLSGHNEVPVDGGPAAADPDGRGHAVLRLRADQICFTFDWHKIDAPTMGHVHSGAVATNGAVQLGLFTGTLPDSLEAATGCVAADADTVADLVAHPGRHYVNLHTAAYPGGAIRGQLRPTSPTDLLRRLRGPLITLMDGGQEVPPAGGDRWSTVDDASGSGTTLVPLDVSLAHGVQLAGSREADAHTATPWAADRLDDARHNQSTATVGSGNRRTAAPTRAAAATWRPPTRARIDRHHVRAMPARPGRQHPHEHRDIRPRRRDRIDGLTLTSRNSGQPSGIRVDRPVRTNQIGPHPQPLSRTPVPQQDRPLLLGNHRRPQQGPSACRRSRAGRHFSLPHDPRNL
jgi:hypothetical protein